MCKYRFFFSKLTGGSKGTVTSVDLVINYNQPVEGADNEGNFGHAQRIKHNINEK